MICHSHHRKPIRTFALYGAFTSLYGTHFPIISLEAKSKPWVVYLGSAKLTSTFTFPTWSNAMKNIVLLALIQNSVFKTVPWWSCWFSKQPAPRAWTCFYLHPNHGAKSPPTPSFPHEVKQRGCNDVHTCCRKTQVGLSLPTPAGQQHPVILSEFPTSLCICSCFSLALKREKQAGKSS